jgi:hypothetical protein
MITMPKIHIPTFTFTKSAHGLSLVKAAAPAPAPAPAPKAAHHEQPQSSVPAVETKPAAPTHETHTVAHKGVTVTVAKTTEPAPAVETKPAPEQPQSSVPETKPAPEQPQSAVPETKPAPEQPQSSVPETKPAAPAPAPEAHKAAHVVVMGKGKSITIPTFQFTKTKGL